MDAYCGSGTIGLCAVKDAQKKGIGIMLLGVERNPAGIADARRNAELNGLTRSAWFMADDATDCILDAADNNERVDVLSIDPPRAGSTPEFLEAACALKPRRITYISCNPVTQERDLHQLLDGGYCLLKITPVDMFPHTDYTETVAAPIADVKLPVLFDSVRIPTWVTLEQADALKNFKITVVAEAIQAATFGNADAAWAAFSAQGN